MLESFDELTKIVDDVLEYLPPSCLLSEGEIGERTGDIP
jgi:hypothetical protein